MKKAMASKEGKSATIVGAQVEIDVDIDNSDEWIGDIIGALAAFDGQRVKITVGEFDDAGEEDGYGSVGDSCCGVEA